ncbi:hypothetical protein LQR30_18570 [Chromobacterium piscinae]|uniref:winged helix-turn-helix domain-containing protein n=1 Tax=Chromobacterium piscinae TaxID=686831 RepID=UPI001E64DE19|nr:hypothetical protein [Chromobacterium piscinae]MCD4506096.1 hypothetical protein [Chromobacterium piscinae]
MSNSFRIGYKDSATRDFPTPSNRIAHQKSTHRTLDFTESFLERYVYTLQFTEFYGGKMHYILEHGQANFDPLNGTLQKNDGPIVKLRHTESLLLQCLLKKINNKREIIDFVWENMVVAEGSYHKLVFDLRSQFLAAGLDATLIKTIPRRGLMYSGQWEQCDLSATIPPLPSSEKLAPPSSVPSDITLESSLATTEKANDHEDEALLQATIPGQKQGVNHTLKSLIFDNSNLTSLVILIISYLIGSGWGFLENYLSYRHHTKHISLNGIPYTLLNNSTPPAITYPQTPTSAYYADIGYAKIKYICYSSQTRERNCRNLISYD